MNELPVEVESSPQRVQRLVCLFRGRNAEARVVKLYHEGHVKGASLNNALMVGNVEVVVPASARIKVATRDSCPGIEVNTDTEPSVPGTWIWFKCRAARECHEVFRDLLAR